MGPWAIVSKDIYILYIFIFLSPVEATASMNFCRSATTQISTICLVAVSRDQSTGISSKRASNTRMFSLLKKRGKKKVYLVVLIILILNTNALSSISTSSFYF